MAKEKPNKKELSLLETKLLEIEKSYGKNTVTQLGNQNIEPYDIVSTGSLLLDKGTGIKGLPRGRIVEIFSSQESSGKTTVAWSAVREAQQSGEICAFIDTEQAADLLYAKKIGVDTKNLYFSQPDTAEQALDIVTKLVESNSFALIVIDSVAGLVPRAQAEGEVGDAHMALLARLMSQELNKLKFKIKSSNTCVLFTNQMRTNIKTMPGFGEKYLTCGGVALKFYASIRMRLSRIKKLKDASGSIYAVIVKAVFVKNKCAAPYSEVEFAIYFTEGLSRYSDIFNAAINYGVLDKCGAWISYNKKNIANGERKCLELFKNDNELYEKVKDEIIQIMDEDL